MRLWRFLCRCEATIRIEEQGKEIENLKEIVMDLRDMIRGHRKDIEDLEDAIWETDEKNPGLNQQIDALSDRIGNLEPDTI